MKKQVWIKVKCSNYYSLFNKIKDLTYIYDLKKYNDYVLIKVDFSDYENLCKYIVSYEFFIIENVGIYSLINRINKNRLFFITTFLGIVLFLIFNNVIVDVEVLHESAKIRDLLEGELESYGISSLTFKKSYEELSLIKEEILNKYSSELDWIEIETTGMKYTVRVEERIITEIEEKDEYCNIYATKNGIITSINVTSGVSMVRLGDYVLEGDLLISGDVIYNEEIKSEVCASGIIMAESWYNANVVVPFTYFELLETGVSKYNLLYENSSGDETNVFNDRIESYESTKTLLFDLFDNKLYLEKQYEVERKYYKYTEEEALEKALELSLENINLKLSEKSSVIDQKVLKKTVNDSTIEVDIFIITEEVISS